MYRFLNSSLCAPHPRANKDSANAARLHWHICLQRVRFAESSIPTLPTMAPPPFVHLAPCIPPCLKKRIFACLPLFPFSSFAASGCASLRFAIQTRLLPTIAPLPPILFPFGLLFPSHRPALNRILSSLSAPVWQNQSTSSCGIMPLSQCMINLKDKLKENGMDDKQLDDLLLNGDEKGRIG